MTQYIEKSALVADIERRIKALHSTLNEREAAVKFELKDILSFINTFEVKDIDTWHLQEKENIYNAVKGWDLYTFVCIMKDGTIQRFNGCRDEDCEGHINVYINGVNDDYDNVDDIVKWIELT